MVCREPVVTDAGVVAVAVLLIFLLWGEMSEVGAFGVSLKRRVEQAEAASRDATIATEALASRLEIHALRVDSAVASSAASSAQAAGGSVIITTETLREVLDDLPGKASAYRGGALSDEPQGPIRQATDFEQAARLLEQWEYIRERLYLPGSPPSRREQYDTLTDLERRDIKRFRAIFADELEVVRATRNAVAHARVVPADAMASALEIAGELRKVIDDPRTGLGIQTR